MTMASRTSRLPLYAQIRRNIEQEFLGKGREPGKRLPSEDGLAARYGASRLTVRRSIDQLVDEGKLKRVHGQGTFVAEQPVPKTEGLTRWSFDLLALGGNVTKRVLQVDEISPTLRVSNLLYTLPAEPVIELKIEIRVDATPLGYTVARIPKAFISSAETWDLQGKELTAYLTQQYELEFGKVAERVRAVAAEEDAAEILGVELGSPLLYVDTLIFLTSGIPAILADTFYVGDKYSYQGLLRPLEQKPSDQRKT
jgi:GntR family transcriptional regulator